MINSSRMFRGKFRSNTCRIILVTSLVWMLIDVLLILHYSDVGQQWNGDAQAANVRRRGAYDIEVRHTHTFCFSFII